MADGHLIQGLPWFIKTYIFNASKFESKDILLVFRFFKIWFLGNSILYFYS